MNTSIDAKNRAGKIPDKWRKQAGFNLIEVLVAMSILSIGFLGLAKTQAESMRNSTNAINRSKAIFLIGNIMENMRANKAEATTNATYITSIGTTVSYATSCQTTASCTATQMGAFDLYQWKTALATYLPSGDGSIARNGSIFTITVRWDESRGGNVFTQYSVTGEI
ncbi:MAG: type IV pilus modification protein PilV [Magnetococcales bacterium]|nr:type IV pilus modification protein PilV [Magnetococcales bacterium]NGZ25480.1 type IV pilus modification protein PilV [Magnetococcales bacterium]